MIGGDRARGQPLLVLAILVAGWVGVRVAAWNLIPDAEGRRVAAEPVIASPAGLVGPARP